MLYANARNPNPRKASPKANFLGVFGFLPHKSNFCHNNAKGKAARIIIAGLIPFVCDAVNMPKLTHLSAHTVRELPACSKQAQNIAHRTARIRIEPILLATSGLPD